MEHEETRWFFDRFLQYGRGMLREPTHMPCPQSFVAACGPLMGVHIEENRKLLWDIFNHAAIGRCQAQNDDHDAREAKRKSKSGK